MLNLWPNFQKREAWQNLTFRGVAGTFLVGCSFSKKKNKLKFEIFNNKKSLQTLFFFVITKNLNWEILTKNVITFKSEDGIKGEKC